MACKFPGIDLSPSALIMRQRADALTTELIRAEGILAQVEAGKLHADTPELNAFRQRIEQVRLETARIEREITS